MERPDPVPRADAPVTGVDGPDVLAARYHPARRPPEARRRAEQNGRALVLQANGSSREGRPPPRANATRGGVGRPTQSEGQSPPGRGTGSPPLGPPSCDHASEAAEAVASCGGPARWPTSGRIHEAHRRGEAGRRVGDRSHARCAVGTEITAPRAAAPVAATSCGAGVVTRARNRSTGSADTYRGAPAAAADTSASGCGSAVRVPRRRRPAPRGRPMSRSSSAPVARPRVAAGQVGRSRCGAGRQSFLARLHSSRSRVSDPTAAWCRWIGVAGVGDARDDVIEETGRSVT
jgi:hypothetical protein